MKPQKTDILYVVIIALVFLLGLAAHLPIPAPTPAKSSQAEQQETSNKDKESRDNNEPTAAFAKSKTNEQPSQGDHESSTNWWLVIFTGGLVIVAILQWLTSQSQAGVMRTGLIETKRSADAAKVSADIATASLKSQRAYLDLDWSISGNTLTCKVSNRGQTAAEIQAIKVADENFQNRTMKFAIIPIKPFQFSHTIAPPIEIGTFRNVTGEIKYFNGFSTCIRHFEIMATNLAETGIFLTQLVDANNNEECGESK